MKIEDLIADLSGRAVPVRPLRSPAIRVIEWSVIAIASGAAGIAAFGVRPDIGVVGRQPEFLWTAVLALSIAAVAGAASLVLAIPGAERSAALRGSTMALVGVWAVTVSAGIIRAGDGFAATGWPVCFIRVVAVGLVPAAVLFAMLRRAAPLRLAWTSGLATIAAMTVGAVAVHFICPHNEPAHALLGHLGPVLALGCVGARAGRRVLARAVSGS